MKFKDIFRSKAYEAFFHKIDRTVDENYWANVYNNTITDSSWLLNKSISPGRWAAGYTLLYILYRILDEYKPKNIIEFGLGQSSKLTCQYQKNNASVKLKIVEHDKDWINYFQKNFNYDFIKHIAISQLEEKDFLGYKTITYKDRSIFLNDKYDLVLIDGPFGSPHYSRPQLLDFIEFDALEEDFIVIVHDCNRGGEKETIGLFEKLLRQKNIDYVTGVYSGFASSYVIASSSNKFFTTL